MTLTEKQRMTEKEELWHDDYKSSPWIWVGGLDFKLTEGDIIVIFSQFGEVIDINLARDKETGKSRGFCWIAFEDQRSTILSVDNLSGVTVWMTLILRFWIERSR